MAVLLLGYAVLRILLIPANPELTKGMTSDGAYLALVAKDLLEGNGFVLDALWLVFLDPGQLPMPFHNANPLFPLTAAAIAALTGTDVVRAGFVISALSNVGVIAATYLIVVRYVSSTVQAFGIAVLVAFSPVAFEMSFRHLTDEFSLMLLLGAVAATLRSEHLRYAALAGALFGLAWLARSMAVLMFPALLCWILLEFGLRRGISRIALLSVGTAVTVAPWLIHNWQVWGDPFRSDNGYLLSIVAYYAQTRDEAYRAWHSPEIPAPIVQLILEHPVQLFRYWVADLRPAAAQVLTGLTLSSYLNLVLLCGAIGVALYHRPRSLVSNEARAYLVYAIAAFASMSVMGRMLEDRYVLPGYALLTAWLFSAIALGIRESHAAGNRLVRNCSVAVLVAFVAAVYIPSTVSSVTELRRPDTEGIVPMARAANIVSETISFGAPVVVGFYPYMYSLITEETALSIPQASDSYLISYMRRYKACCVLLSDRERRFWRPAWDNGPPEGLVLVRRIGDYSVYVLDSRAPSRLQQVEP